MFPSSPPQRRVQQAGGKRVGQPQCPMQTRCNEHRAPACKSCKGHKGVWHYCSRHHKGHPGVMGGEQWCMPVRGGGGQLQLGAVPCRESVHAPAPLFGGGGGPTGCGSNDTTPRRPTGATTRPREGLRGGHIAHGGRPSATPRYTWGPRVG